MKYRNSLRLVIFNWYLYDIFDPIIAFDNREIQLRSRRI